MKNISKPLMPWRRATVLLVFVLLASVLVMRAMDMQVLHSEFFEKQGAARQLRVVTVPSHRGDIVDRNGEPFAVSTPVHSVWVNPQELIDVLEKIPRLAKVLSLDATHLHNRVIANEKREFIYLKRHVSPLLAEQVMALSVPGVALQDEYRRFYPMGEVAAHVIGFSDIDDNGQEGIELAYNDWLQGINGKKLVIRDRLGRAIDDVERLSVVEPGKRVKLSLDKRLQYLTYRALKTAVLKHNATAGSAVVLDVATGKVLAMVNQPSFNVNDRSQLKPSATRNRAVTDVFEPGSTMKPFTVAAALESGDWKPSTKVETTPGYMSVNGNLIRDTRDYGNLSVSGVIAKSSNVGISKIALSLDPEHHWSMYQKLGLGSSTGSGFPGEAAGRLSVSALHNDFERASLSFGYGISVSPLQLARAYGAIAANGVLRPIGFLEDDELNASDDVRVMAADNARSIRKMMQRVVSDEGTGKLAQVSNYSVAGKTGTVHKFIAGGYAEDRYLSIFAGMVPADNPELVMVVVIDEPGKEDYYGGTVAAPVFSAVMTGAMRLLDVPPDNISDNRFVVVPQEKNNLRSLQVSAYGGRV